MISDFVRHKQFDRIGRVSSTTARGDVFVVDVPAPPGWDHRFYGISYWFKENVEPSTFEAWERSVRDADKRRKKRR